MRHSETLIRTEKERDLSNPKPNSSNSLTIQFTVTHKTRGHASGKASILVSNDGIDYFCLDIIDVIGTDKASDGIVNTVGWPFYIARIEELSPDSIAKVTLGLTKQD